MNPVLSIVLAKLRIAGHQIVSVRGESKLKVTVITIAALSMWFGAFGVFFAGFQYLLTFDLGGGGELNLGSLLMSRMLGILGISVFILLIFSNVLVAFSTLYRSREAPFLLHAPLRYDQFFYARFVEILAFSSWSLAFLGSPLMLAYGISTDAGIPFYLAALGFFLPFIVLPASLGCMLTMLLVRIFPRLKMPAMFVLSAAAVILFFLYAGHILEESQSREGALLPALMEATSRTQSPFLPSHWAAQGVLAAARGDFSQSIFQFLLLLSSALMGLLVSGALAQRLFFPGWSYLAGQDSQRLRPPHKGLLGMFEFMLGFLVRQPAQALIAKDVKLFWRDPTQWSQFVIFFGIMAVYIANLRNTTQVYEKEMWRAWVASLNVGSLTLILSTLTSRFVFPLVSLEGRRFWILGLAPLTFRQLVWQKFWLSVGSTSLFTVSLAILSGIMLELDLLYFSLTVYTVILCNFGLAGLAVGLGTLYPTFTEDNPARIVSGMGGTLNLLLSVAYIGMVVATLTIVLQWRNVQLFAAPHDFWYALSGCLAFITLLTAGCIVLPMRMGLRHLNALEF